MQLDFNDKKSVEEDTKYLEVLLSADKILQACNSTNYVQYLFTVMNGVTWHSLIFSNTV
jgi:hypothetical protein